MRHDTVHRMLRNRFGSARNHLCVACGGQAEHWAYQHTAGTEEKVGDDGLVFSENADDYAPMCRSCHVGFDIQMNPDGVARNLVPEDPSARSEKSKAGGRAAAAKRRSCSGCDKVASPAAIGAHQHYGFHEGWVDL